jgi:hypothetical protein
MSMGNIVGSRTKVIQKSDWAYIAGFFDGDGSLMVQIKNRRDTTRGWRIMFTICLYQNTHHKEPLQWMRDSLGIGYLYDRNDGITELRINGYSQVKRILAAMQPYVRFKHRQVEYALKMLEVLENTKFLSLSKHKRTRLAGLYNKLREANYSSKCRKYSAEETTQLLTI